MRMPVQSLSFAARQPGAQQWSPRHDAGRRSPDRSDRTSEALAREVEHFIDRGVGRLVARGIEFIGLQGFLHDDNSIDNLSFLSA